MNSAQKTQGIQIVRLLSRRYNRSLQTLADFALGARLKTLSAVGVPVITASAFAFKKQGVFDTTLFLCTLLSGGFIQCAVNFFNDSADFKTGVDGEKRLGPQRLSARLSLKRVTAFGTASLILSLIFALPLIIRGGWPILALGLTAFALTYLYSGGPFALTHRGLSELFVVVFFGPMAVGGTYYIQTLKWDGPLTYYMGLQCGFWALSLLLINYLRDEESDRRGGRKTLVTVHGREAGILGLAVVQLLIYLFGFYLLDTLPKVGALSFLTLPGSAVLVYLIAVTPPSPRYNRYLGLMSLLYTFFGMTLIIGLR